MNEKKRGINAFDIVFILLVIAIAAGLFFYLRNSSAESELGDKVTYVIEIVSTDPEVGEQISVGDNLTDSTTKTSLGTITKVEPKKTESINIDYDKGEFVNTEIPNKVSLRLTMEADITETATDIKVNGQVEIKVSHSFGLIGPGYQTYGSVVEIDRGGSK